MQISDIMGDFVVPRIIPAMVLRDVVFYPHSILPLYIFEAHYRQMLRDVIEDDRMFTIIHSIPDEAALHTEHPFNECVTLGCVKACQTYSDGTSMVLLEGICRLTVQQCLTDGPYLQLEVAPIIENNADPAALESLRNQTLQLLEKIHHVGGEISDEAMEHLRNINQPHHFVDHAAASFFKSTTATQQLLKLSDPLTRYSTLLQHLKQYYQRFEWIDSIIRDIPPEDIGRN